jgi:hypothetical protein
VTQLNQRRRSGVDFIDTTLKPFMIFKSVRRDLLAAHCRKVYYTSHQSLRIELGLGLEHNNEKNTHLVVIDARSLGWRFG